MKKRLLVLLIAVIVFGLFWFSRGVAVTHFVVPSPAGEVLYAADFEQFTDEWRLYDGRLSAEIHDGSLHIRVDDANSAAFSATQAYYANFDLTVTARAVDGPIDNGFGIIFHLQNKDNATPEDDSYYTFLISSDGYYQVNRALNGQQTIVSNWVPSEAIQQGLDAENQLRVIFSNNRYRFFINGEQVSLCIPNDPSGASTYALGACIQGQMLESYEDASLTQGQIGMIALATASGGSGVEVTFDNMIVRGPTE